MATVLIGTLYPLILDALHLDTISVGAPYFNTVMLPLVFLTLFFMGLVPFFTWHSQLSAISLKTRLLRAGKKITASIFLAIIFLWYFAAFSFIAAISLSLSLWIIFSIIDMWRFIPAMAVAHTGFAVLIIGIMLSSMLSQEQNVRVHPGEQVNVGPYQFFFEDILTANGPNYRGVQAIFEVLKNQQTVTTLYPEKRIYTVRDMVMTKVDIQAGLFRDLYIALGEPLDNNDWSVRIYYKPFVRWIWLGGIMMMLGGILAGLQRRKDCGLHDSSLGET
jgi:cytochrome c-type biogenesis protein CcmF